MLTTLRQTFKRSRPLTRGVHAFRSLLYLASPELFARWVSLVRTGRRLDLATPRTFTEKLVWLMLNERVPLKRVCADKYTLRGHVEAAGLGALLPRLLGDWADSRDVDFESLPARFVLKCSHGSGFNIICGDKRALDLPATRRRLDAWMKVDWSRVNGEVHYAGMAPRILCEPLLEGPDGSLPNDYKLYCFNGRVGCAMVSTSRGLDGKDAKHVIFDAGWTAALPYVVPEAVGEPTAQPPAAYAEMVAAAEKLSAPFAFVRVDFYDVGGRAVLGEMTFTPSACVDTQLTEQAQRELGDRITLG